MRRCPFSALSAGWSWGLLCSAGAFDRPALDHQSSERAKAAAWWLGELRRQWHKAAIQSVSLAEDLPAALHAYRQRLGRLAKGPRRLHCLAAGVFIAGLIRSSRDCRMRVKNE